MYIEKRYWDVLDEANLVGEGLCQGKNDYKTGGIFYGPFLDPKIKHSLIIDDYGIIQEHKTFKEFNDSKRFLDRSQYFRMIEGENLSAMLPRSWKKLFDSGIIIPTKMRFCNECNDRKMCNKCNNQINENKEIAANLNELKDIHLSNLAICFLCINYKLYNIYIENNSRVYNYYYLIFLIFKNMIEDSIEIFIEEFQKYNKRGICVLGSWLFNQYFPDSKIIRVFLIRKNKN